MKIAIIDIGIGNIRSLISTINYIGYKDIILTNKISEINKCDRLLLPGVGSFSNAINTIQKNNIDKTLYEAVIIKQKPIIGICLGMQLLCKFSNEGGYHEGLNFINATVTHLDNIDIKVPHVGFDQVEANEKSFLYDNIGKANDFYFTHSYVVESNDNIGQSFCYYGKKFIASFEYENIVGVQYHPELSQTNGLKILKNFIEKNKC